jgi:hypothetical protein
LLIAPELLIKHRQCIAGNTVITRAHADVIVIDAPISDEPEDIASILENTRQDS